jgi:L-iditol 2-dehydrogenase
MKAIVVKRPNELEMIDVPKPKVGPKDVLAKVSYCGICATDMAIYDGSLFSGQKDMVRYPVRIGHEWSGVVEEVGCDVVGLAPGDKVAGDDGVPCGDCMFCLAGEYQLCPYSHSVGTVGDAWPGAFAEYMLMPARITFKLSPDTDLKEAALIEPAGIAFTGLKKGDIKVGDVVVVVGTGAIGLAAVAMAKSFGAAKVILVGRRDSKLEIGKKMGADVVVNVKKEDAAKAIRPHTKLGLGADVVVETSGNVDALAQCFTYIRNGGRLPVLGFYEQRLDGFDIDRIVLSYIDIKGVAGSANVFAPIISMMQHKIVDFSPLISGVYPAAQYKEAFDKVLENAGDRIKVLIEF